MREFKVKPNPEFGRVFGAVAVHRGGEEQSVFIPNGIIADEV